MIIKLKFSTSQSNCRKCDFALHKFAILDIQVDLVDELDELEVLEEIQKPNYGECSKLPVISSKTILSKAVV